MSDALVRSRQTAAQPPAVVCGDLVVDHGTLAERCERAVGALRGLGLQRGDRIAVLAANCHRYVEPYFGVPSAGMVLVPLNTRLAAAELVGIVRAARPALLVTDREPVALAGEVDRVVTIGRVGRRSSPRRGRLRSATGVHEEDLASSASRAARPDARRA